MLRRWLQQGRTLPAVLAAEAIAAAAVAAGELPGEADGGQEEGPQAGGAAGAQCAGTAASGDEADVVAGAISLSDQYSSGHAWHGEQVVSALALDGGDEALLQLCCRFRQCFVAALQPQASRCWVAVYMLSHGNVLVPLVFWCPGAPARLGKEMAEKRPVVLFAVPATRLGSQAPWEARVRGAFGLPRVMFWGYVDH